MAPKASSKGKGKSPQYTSGCIDYSEIQDSDKYLFKLNSNVLDLRQRHTTVVNFLRMKASEDGCIIMGIPEAYCVHGCPVVEIKVSDQNLSTSFLISKSSLDIVGYSYAGSWFCFNDAEVKILGCNILDHPSDYAEFNNIRLGAKAMREALRRMNDDQINERYSGFQVFSMHLSEAARFLPIQNQINAGIQYWDAAAFVPNLQGWFSWSAPMANLQEEADLQTKISPPYTPDFEFDVGMFQEAFHLVQNWKRLSTAWVIYCAREDFNSLEESVGDIIQQCSIRDLGTFRSTLGILSRVDLKAIQLSEEYSTGSGKEDREKLKKFTMKIKKWEEERKGY